MSDEDLKWAVELVTDKLLDEGYDDAISHADVARDAVAALAEPLRQSQRVEALDTIIARLTVGTFVDQKRIEELEAALREAIRYGRHHGACPKASHQTSEFRCECWMRPAVALLDTEANP